MQNVSSILSAFDAFLDVTKRSRHFWKSRFQTIHCRDDGMTFELNANLSRVISISWRNSSLGVALELNEEIQNGGFIKHFTLQNSQKRNQKWKKKKKSYKKSFGFPQSTRFETNNWHFNTLSHEPPINRPSMTKETQALFCRSNPAPFIGDWHQH